MWTHTQVFCKLRSLAEGVGSPGYCDLVFGTNLKEEDFSRYNVQQERAPDDDGTSPRGDEATQKMN